MINPQFQFLKNIMKDIPIPKNIDNNVVNVSSSPSTTPLHQTEFQSNSNLISSSPTHATDLNSSKPKRGRPKKIKLEGTDCNSYINGIFVQPPPIEGSTDFF